MQLQEDCLKEMNMSLKHFFHKSLEGTMSLLKGHLGLDGEEGGLIGGLPLDVTSGLVLSPVGVFVFCDLLKGLNKISSIHCLRV